MILLAKAATNKVLRKIESKCGIEESEQITFHGLRHTHTSLLISKGIDINYISKRLGHKNTIITRDTYAHLLDNLMLKESQKAIAALEDI